MDKAFFFVGRVFSYLLKGDSTLQSPRKLLLDWILDWMLYSLQDRYRFPCIFPSRMEKFFLNWSMSFFIRKPNAFASCALKLFYLGPSLICHFLQGFRFPQGLQPIFSLQELKQNPVVANDFLVHGLPEYKPIKLSGPYLSSSLME